MHLSVSSTVLFFYVIEEYVLTTETCAHARTQARTRTHTHTHTHTYTHANAQLSQIQNQKHNFHHYFFQILLQLSKWVMVIECGMHRYSLIQVIMGESFTAVS